MTLCEISASFSDNLSHSSFSRRQGSIIVLYKLSFETTLSLSDNTVEDIAQVFRNAQDTNFTIENSSIRIEGTSSV